jgi:hypothetical protein
MIGVINSTAAETERPHPMRHNSRSSSRRHSLARRVTKWVLTKWVFCGFEKINLLTHVYEPMFMYIHFMALCICIVEYYGNPPYV